MINCTAEGGWTYPDAMAVIRKLRDAGIEANITTGGVSIFFDLEAQGNTVLAIVKNHGGAFCKETTTAMLALENAERICGDRPN